MVRYLACAATTVLLLTEEEAAKLGDRASAAGFRNVGRHRKGCTDELIAAM